MEARQSLDWWGKDIEDAERVRRAVQSQKLIAELPSESYRRDYDLYNVRLYEADPSISLYSYAGRYYSTSAQALSPVDESVNNRAKSAIDTLGSQIFSTDQRARFLTVDGSSRQSRRARELQNFTDGLVHELKLHGLKQRAGMDAAILESGKGVIQFYRQGNRVAAQRALATEFSINPLDGMIDGSPRTLYRRRPMPRATTLNTFGDEANQEAIKLAHAVVTDGLPGDHIDVFEQWHLPEDDASEDGRHVIGLEDGTKLLCEPYFKQHHECVFFGLEDRFTTCWGRSLMTQVRRLQQRINANDYRIQRAQKLFHAGHIYVDRAAKIKKSTLTNEIGTVWEGSGPTPPQQILFQAAKEEMYNQIERDGQRIFENLGISLAASQGETNAGLNASAAAKREDTAKSDKRNAVRQQRWEQFHLECVRVALSIVRDIVTSSEDGKQRKTGSSYKVATPGKQGLTVSDWKDIALDEKDYVLEIRAASPIPNEPAGLVALGERMIELRAWKPSQLAGYMQDLDADGRINRDAAKERALQLTFESMLYDKVAAAVPDEFTDYQLAIELGTEYISQGQSEKVSEKRVERIRRYLKRCKSMALKAQAAMAPPPAPVPAAAVA